MRRHAGNLPQLDPIEDMGIMVGGVDGGRGTHQTSSPLTDRQCCSLGNMKTSFLASSSTLSPPGVMQDEELMEAARKIQDLEAELKKNPGRV